MNWLTKQRKRLLLWLNGCEFRAVCRLYRPGAWACTEAGGAHCGMARRLDQHRRVKK